MDRFKFTGILLITIGITLGGILAYLELPKPTMVGDTSVLGVSDIRSNLASVSTVDGSKYIDNNWQSLYKLTSSACQNSIKNSKLKVDSQTFKSYQIDSQSELFTLPCDLQQNTKYNLFLRNQNQIRLLKFEIYNPNQKQIKTQQEIEFGNNFDSNNVTKFQTLNNTKAGFDCGQLNTYSWSPKYLEYQLMSVKEKNCMQAEVGVINDSKWSVIYPTK
jgi:hypothetical protein